MRARLKSIMVSTTAFKNVFHQLAKGRYLLGLAADQNPGDYAKGYWINFFNRLTPFIAGPEKNARINNAAVVFLHYYRVKRGYYQADFTLVTTQPQETARGELTKQFAQYIEACIRKKPSNYLWSHRRWKYQFREEFRKNVYE